ncbi:MAG: alpha/beta hydrolase [Candidatus Eremiobacteraeota bacterium]|nr:alpha/beta hydrolase [Candidatus Eremiobacteraeota bacterium]
MVVLLGLSVALTLLSIWIVVPPWNRPSLIAAVISIECSPYLLLLNAGALVAILRAPRSGLRKAAAVLAVANLSLSALPPFLLFTQTKDAAATFSSLAAAQSRGALRETDIPVVLGQRRTAMHAYLPDSLRPAPIVAAVYGGAWRNGSPSNDAMLDRALAARGYAVFAFDYRHSPAVRFPSALEDVKAQLRFIERKASEYHADPNRIAIVGHSSGAELALLAAYGSDRAVRAVVSYSGPIDLAQAYRFPPHPDPIDVRAILRDYIGGAPSGSAERYRLASPIAYVRKGLPPTLLIYGARDHVVKIEAATALRDALESAGTKVTLIRLPWAEHAFENIPFGLHAPVVLYAVERFLDSAVKAKRS